MNAGRFALGLVASHPSSACIDYVKVVDNTACAQACLNSTVSSLFHVLQALTESVMESLLTSSQAGRCMHICTHAN